MGCAMHAAPVNLSALILILTLTLTPILTPNPNLNPDPNPNFNPNPNPEPKPEVSSECRPQTPRAGLRKAVRARGRACYTKKTSVCSYSKSTSQMDPTTHSECLSTFQAHYGRLEFMVRRHNISNDSISSLPEANHHVFAQGFSGLYAVRCMLSPEDLVLDHHATFETVAWSLLTLFRVRPWPYIPHPANCTQHATYFTLHTTHCTLHTSHCSGLVAIHAVPDPPLTLHPALYTLHTTHSTPDHAPPSRPWPGLSSRCSGSALQPTSHTLHTTHFTLHNTHSTLHALHYKIHTTHYILHTL